ncbi:hypothetical protein [Vibrio sp. 1CM24A]|uniref:hypothetical protein n=1 Tax=Vibrio sp. 1CM24A TaxID=2929165 RepID=UPI0020C157B3|nr:hypothetical protein [Vibrio sp. 1CM24A]MCK8083773.1 hypothetical protein [Vibrio sp. 1CM24A]
MKVKYYFYYLKDKKHGKYLNYNVTKHLEAFCLSHGVVDSPVFIQNSDVDTVFHMTLPTLPDQYAAVDRQNRKSQNIKDAIGKNNTLEKRTYLCLSESHPFFSLTSNLSGANDVDFQGYIQAILNTIESDRYEFIYSPVYHSSTRDKMCNFKAVTNLRFDLDTNSKDRGVLSKLLNRDIPSGLVAQITLKRESVKDDITEDISDILSAIAEDVNEENYKNVSLKARRDENDRALRNFVLDEKGTLYVENINPYKSDSIELQMLEATYKNNEVINKVEEALKEISHAFSHDSTNDLVASLKDKGQPEH